jgi:putative methyltransferase (TIGR04325 family)
MPQFDRNNIWSGIYQNFQQVGGGVGALTDPWNHPIWLEKAISAHEQSVRDTHIVKDYLLANFLAVISACRENPDGPIELIDVGGGLASSYSSIKNTLPNSKLNYYIVENDMIVAEAKSNPLFSGNKELIFCSDITDIRDVKNIILLHYGSVVQYVEDYQTFLRLHITYSQPNFILFDDLFVGDIPNTITCQNFYSMRIPFQIINLQEFLFFMGSLGYQLILMNDYERLMLGERDPLPMKNLPPENQIKYAKHIAFKKY